MGSMSELRQVRVLQPGFAATARVHGFDTLDNVVLSGLHLLPGELVAARTTVPVPADRVGATAVVVFENGDARLPIVIGLIERGRPACDEATSATPPASADTNCERLAFTAQRELTLRCGDASITLTRGGKVVIAGHYILTRSTGYNRIKGAVIDIN
jgi:hypothetical protein